MLVVSAAAESLRKAMGTLEKIYQLIDSKIDAIEKQNIRPAIIIVNDTLFRQAQQDMLMRDMQQSHGVVRSPHSLNVHRGIRVVTSSLCETAEVF